MTPELAKKINETISENAEDYGGGPYTSIPENEEDLKTWRENYSIHDAADIFAISDCENCPVDIDEFSPDGCNIGEDEDCVDRFYEWAKEEDF